MYVDDLIVMHNALGITRGLIVQSFQHGFSYEYMLHTFCREPKRFRGCIDSRARYHRPRTEVLADAGVVATRFGFKSAKKIDRRMLTVTAALGCNRIISSMASRKLPHGESRSSQPQGAS